jgi:hypothetical protein
LAAAALAFSASSFAASAFGAIAIAAEGAAAGGLADAAGSPFWARAAPEPQASARADTRTRFLKLTAAFEYSVRDAHMTSALQMTRANETGSPYELADVTRDRLEVANSMPNAMPWAVGF